MDSTYLEELIREVNLRGGGIILSMAGKSEAVVLNIQKYNDLMEQLGQATKTATNTSPMKKSQTILVTGGAGYVGSHTVRQLLTQGYKVVIVDNLSTGKKEFVAPQATFYEGNFGDPTLLTKIFAENNIDAVMHFAASLEVEESVAKPAEYLHNNVIHTITLLAEMNRANVKKIIFSSTGAVYGEQIKMPIPETAELNPGNPYGYTKYLGEVLLKYYAEHLGFQASVLRYFNVCGASFEGDLGDTHINSHLIPIIMEVAKGVREKLTVFGNDYNTFDGTCVRDYIHVLDVAEAHILALEKLGTGDSYNVYNLGTGKGLSVEEMVAAVAEITERMVPMEMGPRRAGDAPSTVADNSKIKRELGFEPKFSDLDTIIKTTWNRMTKNSH